VIFPFLTFPVFHCRLDPYTDPYYDYEIERFWRGGQYENFRVQYTDPDPYRNYRVSKVMPLLCFSFQLSSRSFWCLSCLQCGGCNGTFHLCSRSFILQTVKSELLHRTHARCRGGRMFSFSVMKAEACLGWEDGSPSSALAAPLHPRQLCSASGRICIRSWGCWRGREFPGNNPCFVCGRRLRHDCPPLVELHVG